MNAKRLFLVLPLSIAFVSSPLFSAQVSNKEAIAKLTALYGPQAAKLIREKNDYKIEGSLLTPDKQNIALEKTMKTYTEIRAQFSNAKYSAEWLSLGVGGGTAAVAMLAGPQAAVTIPAILVGATITSMIELGNYEIERQSSRKVREYLKSKENEILRHTGLTLEQLRKNPEKAQEALLNGDEVFEGLYKRANGDQKLLNFHSELIAQTLINTSVAQWERIVSTEKDVVELENYIVDLSENLVAYAQDVNGRLSDLEVAYSSLSSAVHELEVSFKNIDTRVGSLEKDRAVISDFIFDQMTPRQKVTALENDKFMPDKFSCSDGTSDCDQANLRFALINHFEKVADLQEFISITNRTVGSLYSVGKIANDLGVGSPELNQAINFSTSIGTAFGSYLSGNYLGAISSVTGLFSSPKDPDEERFKILMNVLRVQFEQINKKLNAILENQAKLMASINSLSDQIQTSFMHLNRTLERIEFEQKRISSAIRELIWDDWKSCYSVYQKALEKRGHEFTYINPNTLYFKSEEAILNIRSTVGDSALECMKTMQADMSSISATERFGNFVNLKWAISSRLNIESDSSRSDEFYWKSELQYFLDHIFEPSKELLFKSIVKLGEGGGANTYVRLARPFTTTDEWRANYNSVQMLPFDCDNFISYHERMYQSLCNHRGTNEDIVALKLMSDPILADVVNDISRWVMVLAQLADLRNQENGKWLTYSELFDLAQDNRLNNTESTGKSLVTMAISVVDLAIVSYSMTYGPDVAELCLKDIIESTENAKSAISIAKKNSFIANNMSQLLAEKLYTGKKYSRPPKTVYRTAFLLAQDKSDNNFTLLKELFGQTVEITLNKYGVPSFKLQVEGEELLLALPAPGAMVEGRLSMPRRYFELLGTREQLVDRLSGYNILDGLDDEEAIFISEKISRTINTDLN